MIANYGYKDGSGEYFIIIDTDQCDGCGDCVKACPENVFQLLEEDPNDPLRDEPVVVVPSEERKKIKYTCGPCKPTTERPPLPCISACAHGAVSHSW